MKGLKDLSTARKSAFDAEEKVLERVRREQAKVFDKAQKEISAAAASGRPVDPLEALRKVREDIYGIVS